MIRFILPIAVLTLYIYVFLDFARAPSMEVRLLPKWLWGVVVLFLIVLGPILWLLLGRPLVGNPPAGGEGGGRAGGRGSGPRGPVAPDDDPEFLKRLDEQSWSAKMERRRRERDGG